ncbi:hypothetical protein [Aeromonas sp. s12]|uniref:phage head spike fiber domain-containing protein n=1 Tax=Aeromonas sp. s12 TaxID=3138482 RepID=UPI0034A30C2B
MAGVWKRDGTVAVTNGSKKVTGTGTTFADAKNGVAKGHLFCMTTGTTVDLYEVDYVVSNTELHLVQAFRGTTGTGKAYEIITTFSDSIPEFARKLNASLSYYQSQSDMVQQLFTSDAAEITVTAPDGTTHKLIPWKRVTSDGEGQAARAKVEADRSKTEADRSGTEADRAAGIVAQAALPMPDVWAPLSDSLRMITGYGRDVLVGSDVVARMVNFSRNSTATYIGKDGLLKTAAVNEPRFEKEGLLLEGQSTNLVPNSKNPPPTTSETSVTPVASPYGDVFKFAAATTNNSMKDVRFAPLTAGQLVTLSFIAKKAEIDTVAVGFDGMFSALFNLTSVSVGGVPSGSSATITPIGDGFYRVTLTTTTTRDVTPSLRLKVNGTFVANAIGDGMLIGNLQAELLPFASSYIQTNGAAVTRAADQAWLPAAGNRFIGGLYAAAFEFDLLGRVAGAGFSRLVDFDNSGGADRQHISLNEGGQLQCVMGTGQVAGVAGKLAGRAAMRMNNFSLNVMMDGVAGSSVTASGVNSSLNNRIVLMNSNQFNLPSYGHIRNLRMWSKHPISNDQLRTAA